MVEAEFEPRTSGYKDPALTYPSFQGRKIHSDSEELNGILRASTYYSLPWKNGNPPETLFFF